MMAAENIPHTKCHKLTQFRAHTINVPRKASWKNWTVWNCVTPRPLYGGLGGNTRSRTGRNRETTPLCVATERRKLCARCTQLTSSGPVFYLESDAVWWWWGGVCCCLSVCKCLRECVCQTLYIAHDLQTRRAENAHVHMRNIPAHKTHTHTRAHSLNNCGKQLRERKQNICLRAARIESIAKVLSSLY